MLRTKPQTLLWCLLLALIPATSALAQSSVDAKIASATSAAIPSITDNATIKDWPATEGGEMTTLREGTNGWTCLPDIPDTDGTDPMCLDGPWMKWAGAWMNNTDPDIDKIGFGYMLKGGAAESNTDPYAEGPTPDNEWMADPVPHIMIIVPDESVFAGVPSDPDNGGPWVMWRDTPYAHIMAPMPEYMSGMQTEM